MDPNPKNFPILNYVMARLPSIGPLRAAASDSIDYDVEQPPPLSPSKEPYFELTERMPHLTDRKLIAAMRLAVVDVSKTRSILRRLGERPDHESVDAAKAKLAEIENNLSNRLEDIELSPLPDGAVSKEEEYRKAADKERQLYKALVSLDEMHEAYGKLLADAEKRLEKLYEAAAAGGGGGVQETSDEAQPVAKEVNEEVVAILQDALGKGVERIDLSQRRLRFLPEAFGRLHTLVALNLSSNQLEAIPDSIAGLENIEELNLSSNILESLPDSIGLLLKLKILDVSSNKLTALPDSISRCRSLVELDASFNKLSYLPTNIGYELVNLKRLSIHLNKIRSLPTSIGEMESLRLLDVHFNELRGLPLSIGRLSNLEILNLSSNFSDLTGLPHTIGDLTNLKELDISNNQIHELPVTFGRLDNLTKLNVDQNPLTVPPKEVIDQGIEAVKVFMAKKWLDRLVEEEEKSMLEEKEQTQTQAQAQAGWLTRSTTWLTRTVSGVSGTVTEYLGAKGKPEADPYLDQQL